MRDLADTYAAFLAAHDAPNVADVCFTAGAGGVHGPCRAAVIGTEKQALVEALRSLEENADAGSGSAGPPRVVFVFPGQGGQWAGMGRELLDESRVFASRIADCAEIVDAELGWSLVDRLRSDQPLNAIEEIQPALWAIQVALASVWQDWGIEPDLIIGHSMGEIAAATVAGALTVKDAAKVVCRRSIVLRDRAEPGGMWSVGLGESEANEAIAELELADRVCVGVLNSPRYSVLSGDPDALSQVVEPLLERGVFCRRVKVSYASHSPQVETLRPAVLDALSDLAPRSCAVPMHSTVWNAVVDGHELDASYWMENLRRPVRFAPAIGSALADAVPTLFVEISPHPTLATALAEAIEDERAVASAAITSLRRRRPERLSMLEGLGTAYTAGCDPLWSRVYSSGSSVSLPDAAG